MKICELATKNSLGELAKIVWFQSVVFETQIFGVIEFNSTLFLEYNRDIFVHTHTPDIHTDNHIEIYTPWIYPSKFCSEGPSGSVTVRSAG
jgi:hypothetical protein